MTFNFLLAASPNNSNNKGDPAATSATGLTPPSITANGSDLLFGGPGSSIFCSETNQVGDSPGGFEQAAVSAGWSGFSAGQSSSSVNSTPGLTGLAGGAGAGGGATLLLAPPPPLSSSNTRPLIQFPASQSVHPFMTIDVASGGGAPETFVLVPASQLTFEQQQRAMSAAAAPSLSPLQQLLPSSALRIGPQASSPPFARPPLSPYHQQQQQHQQYVTTTGPNGQQQIYVVSPGSRGQQLPPPPQYASTVPMPPTQHPQQHQQRSPMFPLLPPSPSAPNGAQQQSGLSVVSSTTAAPTASGDSPVANGVRGPGIDYRRFKTRLCVSFQNGECTWGQHCAFAHGLHEINMPAGDTVPKRE